MWTSDDEYCENAYQNLKRAQAFIEKFKNAKNDNLKFAARYMHEILEDNEFLQKQKDNYFTERNDAIYKRDIYKTYAHYLQNILKIKQPNRIEYLRKRFKVDTIEGGE